MRQKACRIGGPAAIPGIKAQFPTSCNVSHVTTATDDAKERDNDLKKTYPNGRCFVGLEIEAKFAKIRPNRGLFKRFPAE